MGSEMTRRALRDALRDRLDRFVAHDDPAEILADEAAAQAARLAALADPSDPVGMESCHLLGWFHVYRYQCLNPPGAVNWRESPDLRTAVEMFSRCYLAGWDLAGLPRSLLPVLANETLPAVSRMFELAYLSTDLRLISVTIDSLRRFLVAAEASDANRAAAQSNLGTLLHQRFDLTSEPADLDDAVRAGRESVELAPAGSLERAQYASNLGNVLLARCDRTGAPEDLNEALAILESAAAAFPADDPDRVKVAASLMQARYTRFLRNGTRADLDEALRIGGEALAVVDEEPVRATLLAQVGYALVDRFDETGALADLDQAVRAAREAVALLPVDHADGVSVRVCLGIALRNRAGRSGSLADLDEAIRISRDTLDALPPDHLLSRFRLAGAPEDLDEAVLTAREAVAMSPGEPTCNSALAAALEARFRHSGAQADLADAVRSARTAFSATPADHPSRALYGSNLGNIARVRYGQTGDPSDLDEAIAGFTAATEAEGGAPWIRAWAARGAGSLAAASRPALAASLLERAVRLLPEVAPRQMTRDDQQYELGRLSGIAADAAALALSDPSAPADGRAGTALRLLESGRAVLLSQALEVRGDLAELASQHPDLAARFARLRERLDDDRSSAPGDGGITQARLGENRRRLAAELRDALEQIRAQDDFGSFGLPPSTAELVRQAGDGPVVALGRGDQPGRRLSAGRIPSRHRDAVADRRR